jgi:hypothetical protein
MFVTDCTSAQQLSLEGFETFFLQVGLKFLFAALIIGLIFAEELFIKQPKSHQRRNVLGLKTYN